MARYLESMLREPAPSRVSPIRGQPCSLARASPGSDTRMDVKSYWVRARSKPPAVVLALSASLGAIGAFMPTPAAQQAAADAQERTRLLALQRDAVTQLQQAARAGAPADQVRRALLDASRSLDALSAGPDPDAAPATTPARPRLDPSLRARASSRRVRAHRPGIGRHSSASRRRPALCSRSSKRRGLNSRETSRSASRSRAATARRSPRSLPTGATRRRWVRRRRTSHRPKTARRCR